MTWEECWRYLSKKLRVECWRYLSKKLRVVTYAACKSFAFPHFFYFLFPLFIFHFFGISFCWSDPSNICHTNLKERIKLHYITWLLFSELVRLESGKWIWHCVLFITKKGCWSKFNNLFVTSHILMLSFLCNKKYFNVFLKS